MAESLHFPTERPITSPENREGIPKISPWEAVRKGLAENIIPRVIQAKDYLTLKIRTLSDENKEISIELKPNQLLDLDTYEVYNNVIDAIEAHHFTYFEVVTEKYYGKIYQTNLYGIKDGSSVRLGNKELIEEKTNLTLDNVLEVLNKDHQ